jgi:hypothetical protein
MLISEIPPATPGAVARAALRCALVAVDVQILSVVMQAAT